MWERIENVGTAVAPSGPGEDCLSVRAVIPARCNFREVGTNEGEDAAKISAPFDFADRLTDEY